MIAAGALALSPHLNERSFILRAKVYLEESEANLSWLSGEQTGNHLKHTDMEELIDSPHVQYLSQQFVDQLCSAEGLNGELITEIERVIFNSHPLSERSGASSFKELLQIRLESSTQKRERQHETLKKASSDLTEERVKKDGLKALEKEFEETKKNIEKDKADRTSLVSKGNEERAKRHEEISLAVDAKRQLVEQAKRRHQTLIYLQNDVLDFRSRVATSMLTELKNDREDASLTSEDWESFRVDYVGQVDVLLADKIKQVHSLVAHLQGPSKSDPAILQDADPNISLTAGDFSLEEQTLDLLQREQSRLRNLIGIDAENAKRFTLLSDKITKSESALAKLGQQIERIQGADERIQTLLDTRRSAYAGVIEAIIEEENELVSLYKPIKERIDNSSGSLSKLSFSVRRNINIDNWAAIGEGLLDLRTNGPFKGRGELLNLANENLLPAWSTGDASQIAAALLDFAKTNESALKAHRPDAAEYREWALKISNWLYSTGHITVGYGLQYDEVDIEQLSPGTRGIVLLLLYLAIDAEDDRPLIIDQPEENLDPQSIFQELVHRFREAKMRRQIIIVMSIGV